ncbi:MCE family protein [Nocardia yunnanensis]|uniref:MCE family protein n=1 Tax=Nocardia yunnanensis TaxID=2382165 RepID=A0A386ZRQ5_9NOCA|nr:MlaD family protein [Nocardia yunnanensis]AYF79409.1 MCE family protein [Nocardia yunnanensis]
MLRRLFASRGLVSLLGALVVATVVAVAAIVMWQPMQKRIAYCAIMPDAIGLYVGNDVSLRGIKVGEVTGIRAQGTGIRVDFRIDADHPLRGDVTVTTVSDTIVADRRLAVNGGKGPDWQPGTCITKTATPKSITQTLDALAKLADQLDGGDDPAQHGRISAAVAEFDKATAGTGPKLNDIITQLAGALRSPDTSIAHLGALIDTMTSLSKSVADGWGDLRTMLAGLSPVLQLVNQVWGQVVQIVNSIVVILPMFNDITTKYGGPILELLDKTVPFLDLAAAHVGSLQQLIDMIPVAAQGFREVTDPQTGRLMVSYAAPRVALAQPDAEQVCAAVNALAPGRCAKADGGLASVDLSALVLGLAGGVK